VQINSGGNCTQYDEGGTSCVSDAVEGRRRSESERRGTAVIMKKVRNMRK
jgi:hypothetical protein